MTHTHTLVSVVHIISRSAHIVHLHRGILGERQRTTQQENGKSKQGAKNRKDEGDKETRTNARGEEIITASVCVFGGGIRPKRTRR